MTRHQFDPADTSRFAQPESHTDSDGVLRFTLPPRPAGSASVLQLRTEPLPAVRVGIVGLGLRGPVAALRLAQIEGVEIRALCDISRERAENARKVLQQAGHGTADIYDGPRGWIEMCRNSDTDLIYICTPWDSHAMIAIHAMECGRHAAVEIPAAVTLAEAAAIVDTAERTRRHCMMLENCVYDNFELTTLAMAHEGLFGRILNVDGGYIHLLDELEPWRLEFNRTHRGDLYASHGLGPACQLLDIHRGDRLDTLVCFDTASVCGARLSGGRELANGDITTTLLRTVRGSTIMLRHDVFTPQPYSRMYRLTGSDGFADKYPVERYAFRPAQLEGLVDTQRIDPHAELPADIQRSLCERFRPRITEHIADTARRIDPQRDGINYITDYRLIHCLRHGLPLDQDVYDAAEWSCIGPLTAASLARGGAPVGIPDFTRGQWDAIKGYRHA